MSDENTNTIEIWKLIPGYEGYYSASTLGRIRRDERGTGRRGGHIMRSCPDKGYLRLWLCKDGKRRNYRAHTLIALTFIGPRPEKHGVNHIDAVKTNNRPENLEYTTQANNMHHAAKLGLVLRGDKSTSRRHPELFRGEKSARHKLTEDQVREIRHLLSQGVKTIVLAKRYGVQPPAIYSIGKRLNWRHVK